MKTRSTGALVGLALAAGCATAQVQADSSIPDGSREAKTIQLLLQLQGSASAPSSQRSGELPPLRDPGKRAEPPPPGEDNPFALRPDMRDVNPHAAPVQESRVDPVDLPSERTARSPRAVQDPMESAPDLGRFLPVQFLRFLRENREIVIGLSLGVLVLLAVAGATASSGSKRR